MTTTADCSPTCSADDDDLFVNEAIIGGGYARPLSIGPNAAYADRFVAAATAAEAADLGLWGACGG